METPRHPEEVPTSSTSPPRRRLHHRRHLPTLDGGPRPSGATCSPSRFPPGPARPKTPLKTPPPENPPRPPRGETSLSKAHLHRRASLKGRRPAGNFRGFRFASIPMTQCTILRRKMNTPSPTDFGFGRAAGMLAMARWLEILPRKNTSGSTARPGQKPVHVLTHTLHYGVGVFKASAPKK